MSIIYIYIIYYIYVSITYIYIYRGIIEVFKGLVVVGCSVTTCHWRTIHPWPCRSSPVALDRNPVSGKWEEKHLSSPPSVPSEKKTHLYSHLSAENAEKTAASGEDPTRCSIYCHLLSSPGTDVRGEKVVGNRIEVACTLTIRYRCAAAPWQLHRSAGGWRDLANATRAGIGRTKRWLNPPRTDFCWQQWEYKEHIGTHYNTPRVMMWGVWSSYRGSLSCIFLATIVYNSIHTI